MPKPCAQGLEDVGMPCSQSIWFLAKCCLELSQASCLVWDVRGQQRHVGVESMSLRLLSAAAPLPPLPRPPLPPLPPLLPLPRPLSALSLLLPGALLVSSPPDKYTAN